MAKETSRGGAGMKMRCWDKKEKRYVIVILKTSK